MVVERPSENCAELRERIARRIARARARAFSFFVHDDIHLPTDVRPSCSLRYTLSPVTVFSSTRIFSSPVLLKWSIFPFFGLYVTR